jgi:hypothetical protein
VSGAGGGWGGEDGDLPINTIIFDDQIIKYYFNYYIIKYYFNYYIIKYYFNYHIILKSIIMRICKMHGATLCLSDRPLQEAKMAVGGPRGGGLIRFVYVVEHALPLYASSISALPRENISIKLCLCCFCCWWCHSCVLQLSCSGASVEHGSSRYVTWCPSAQHT